MKRIALFIKENKLKPSDCIYHTWRDLKDKSMKINGKIRILVPKKDGIARTEYICPECGQEGYVEKEWKRPFYVVCSKCEFKMKVPKLKNEIKKEKKMQKAK